MPPRTRALDPAAMTPIARELWRLMDLEGNPPNRNQLADRADIPRNTVYSWFDRRQNVPDPDNVRAVAAALRFTSEEDLQRLAAESQGRLAAQDPPPGPVIDPAVLADLTSKQLRVLHLVADAMGRPDERALPAVTPLLKRPRQASTGATLGPAARGQAAARSAAPVTPEERTEIGQRDPDVAAPTPRRRRKWRGTSNDSGRQPGEPT